MAEVLQDVKKAKPPNLSELPIASRTERREYDELTTLSRAGGNFRVPSEATYSTVPKADRSVAVADRAQKLFNEGNPLDRRFAALVEKV
ncbi:Uncharacterised protein [Candidatus Bilamarchaeum dharawalense]|uniref:Uncharacterized protein n=1 Tax=Candidatus Bilamarchaeum dharawalense TaxID=2885759 RepID=A0A5E4LRB9_9ARCH|nr:Uncharacterised protein [Candidatus Bilamarchaeum dharawalense]